MSNQILILLHFLCKIVKMNEWTFQSLTCFFFLFIHQFLTPKINVFYSALLPILHLWRHRWSTVTVQPWHMAHVNRCQFHQHLHSTFFLQKCFASFSLSTLSKLCNFLEKEYWPKSYQKLLMKLTSGTDAIKKFTPSLGILSLGV